MQVVPTPLDDVVEIHTARHGDDRGYFSETFRTDFFETEIAPLQFVQENQSLSRNIGVVRGLHAQSHPFAQGKLVRCLVGEIFDVAVDIRHGSPNFGKWTSVVLSADKGNQLWVPPGFLHGFCTLTQDTLVCYKVTNYYSHANNLGVQWDDPEIGIEWPDVVDTDELSNNDKNWPALSAFPARFEYSEEKK